MDKIWANRLVAGAKTWSDVPASRKNTVKAELDSRVNDGIITMEQYEEILGTTAETE